MASSPPTHASPPACPICGMPCALANRPFCSARCRDIDLLRWLKGNYVLPGGGAELDEDGDDSRPPGMVMSTERFHEDD